MSENKSALMATSYPSQVIVEGKMLAWQDVGCGEAIATRSSDAEYTTARDRRFRIGWYWRLLTKKQELFDVQLEEHPLEKFIDYLHAILTLKMWVGVS